MQTRYERKLVMININLNRHTVLAICASLMLLVGITLSYALWQWHRDWLLAHQETITVSPLATIDETAEMIAAIPSYHLFGQSFSNGTVPITNLQLRVTGIVKSFHEANGGSKAYISISGQPGKIFQVGDNLPYGVKVYEITPDTVILQNDGRLEKLPLPREKIKFKPNSTFKSIQERL